MSSVVIAGNTSGSITLSAPDVAGTTTLTLPSTSANIATDVNGTLYPLKSATSVASTSGTSIDFTGIPSWVKRITVMFNGVSLSGTALPVLQIGDSGGIENTGYTSFISFIASGSSTSSSATTYFPLRGGSATPGGVDTYYGTTILTNLNSNLWLVNGTSGMVTGNSYTGVLSGSKTTSDTLDRIRITSSNGTDTFDAGSINIMYE